MQIMIIIRIPTICLQTVQLVAAIYQFFALLHNILVAITKYIYIRYIRKKKKKIHIRAVRIN